MAARQPKVGIEMATAEMATSLTGHEIGLLARVSQ